MKYRANILLVWEAPTPWSAELSLNDAIAALEAALSFYNVQIIADEKPVPEEPAGVFIPAGEPWSLE